MLPAFVLPETKVREHGMSPDFDLGEPHAETILISLGITHIVEQESLGVSIWASPDGLDWGTDPILSFPKKSYIGIYTMIARLEPRMRYLRANWHVNRWGRDNLKPLFGIWVLAENAAVRAMAGVA